MAQTLDSDLVDPHFLANAAAEIYGMRRARDRVIPNRLVGEPAWDMLLALYSEQPGTLTLTSLQQGSGVPLTTTMRWIEVLEDEGFVERSAPCKSSGLGSVSLTGKGRGIVEECLRAMLHVVNEDRDVR